MASALVVVGAVAFATPAFAQDTTTSAPGNVITSTASCNSPLGTGVQITWTLANNSNVPETGSVTTVTGGNGTLNATTYSIPASSGQPAQTATLTQTLPAGATGVITLEVSSTWPDAHSQIDSGTFDLSTVNCAAPHQTIAGHIYLCNNGNPTTTEEAGGTLAASGTGLSTVPPVSNPSAPTDVIAGAYTMTATNPPDFHLVGCGGSSSPNGAGTSATESVSVPSGGAGEGLFYAAADVNPNVTSTVNSTQTIAGHIYLCDSGSRTTSEVSGGTIAAGGTGLTTVPPTANPSGPTDVIAGTYTMTATNPSGYQLVTCGGSSSTNGAGTSATESVSVPSAAAGVGVFYVTPSSPSTPITKTAGSTSSPAPGSPVTPLSQGSTTGNLTLNPFAATDPLGGLPNPCPDASIGLWSSGCMQNPAIKLKKSASVDSFSAPGTLVTYSYKVTNTGNVTLDPVVVSDPMAGLSDISCPDTSLGPLDTETCTATYTTTQSDVDHGSLCNTGTATGTPPKGDQVTDMSSLCIPAKQNPSISVVKTANVATVSAVGQVVTYTFTITNTGNVTLHSVGVTDAQITPSLASSLGTIICTPPNGSITLAPGETDTCTATYTVTQADLTNGHVDDTATASGTPPNSETPVTDTSSLSLTVTSVSVVKAVSPSSVVAGSTTPIVYTITVKNTGTATTTAPIIVTDAAPSNATLDTTTAPTCQGGPPTCLTPVVSSSGTITWTIPSGVAPGTSYTLTYQVTAKSTDSAGDTISNTASWSGPSCGTPVITTCNSNTVTTTVTAPPVPTPPAAPTPPVATLTTTNTPPQAQPPPPVPAIAFTGAFLPQEWAIGAAALWLGAGLVVLARWRRRSPKGVAK